jgi:hypothetical protein
MVGGEGDVAAAAAALEALALALVELLAHLHPWLPTEVQVLPPQTNVLGDPKAGVGEELEEQAPVIVDRSQQGRELDAGQGLRLLLIALTLGPSGNPHARDRVRADQVVVDGRSEHRRERCTHLLDLGRARAGFSH